jgi:Kef-type K+ transport system membrane component KefB
MTSYEIAIFFLQIAAMLSVALICGQVMRKFRLPAVLGELIGGILIGPTLLGALAPSAYHWLFPPLANINISREALLTLSIVLFLLVVGMELNPGHLKSRGQNIIWTSALGILFPFALGYGLVVFFPDMWGTQAGDHFLSFALFMGTALSISALPVISRILLDLNLLKSRIGTVIISSATINDLAGWFLLAVIMNGLIVSGEPQKNLWLMLAQIFGLFIFILTLGRWIVQRLLLWYERHFSSSGILVGIFILLALLAASAAEAVGIHAIFGAFLVGLALAQNKEKRGKAHETLYQVANYLFAPLYFVSIGLRADFAANFDLPLVIILVLVASLGKIGGATLGAWISKMPPREALAVGFGMNARGAMEILIASIALQYHIIDQRIFVALVITAFVTTIIASPVMQRLMQSSLPPVRAAAKEER